MDDDDDVIGLMFDNMSRAEGMINDLLNPEWNRTRTVNKYSLDHNYIAYHPTKECHCLVYRRARGWAFVCRIPVDKERYKLLGTNNSKVFPTVEIAKFEGWNSLLDLVDSTDWEG